MNLQDRINELFTDNPDKKPSELAAYLGITRTSVSDWMTGKSKNINADNTFGTAKFFNANPEWVGTGKGPKYRNAITIQAQLDDVAGTTSLTKGNDNHYKAIKNSSNVESGPALAGRIPLISWVQAGNWREIMETHEPQEWIDTTAKVTSNAYALRVVGDSMTNPHGTPSIPEGYIVIVEPDVPYKNRSIVVARLENSNEAILKQFIIDGPNRYLKSLNPAYRPIEINDNCVICGVVQKAQFDL